MVCIFCLLFFPYLLTFVEGLLLPFLCIHTCVTLSIKRQSPVQCLHELSLAKCGQLIVNGFISEEIDDMITFICEH